MRIQSHFQLGSKRYHIDNSQSFAQSTYNNIEIAAISTTAFGARPVLIPNVRTIRHVFAADLLASGPSRTSLRHVKLFGGSLGEVRRTAPADFGHANILALLAGLDRVQTFFRVGRLVCADVAFKTVA